MSEIMVIGVDSSGLSSRHEKIVRQCCLIVSSGRLAGCLADPPVEVVSITPLDKAFEKIAEALPVGNVAVLASGDPLLFGIGGKIIEHFGGDNIRVYPALSSIQEAFAGFRLPWSDAGIVSLHGRRENNIPGLLLCRRKSAVFTDSSNAPDTIATTLLQYLRNIGDDIICRSTVMHVAENLGMDDETISHGSLEEIAKMRFSNLNVVCLLVPDLPERPVLGLSEEDIAHSRGLITKNEVRAAALHSLRLPRKGVFWDIGGGSGSVSMEAAAMHPRLNVYTIERKEEEIQNIKDNIRRFGLFNIIPIPGNAADHMEMLPDPDAVFVGGSGGELEKIIAMAAGRLSPDGRLVVNGVTEETVTEAPRLMQRHGMTVELSRIEVSRMGPDGPTGFNPITIMVGRK